MAAGECIVFQPYILGRRGEVAPGQPIACRSEAEARRRAEKARAGGRVVGAHVVRVAADEEAGEFGEPEYLAVFGTVPEPA